MAKKKILITGGAGFIGCNAARFFGETGWHVILADNLSRRGTERNLAWIQSLDFSQENHRCDIRDRSQMENLFRETKPDAVLHLAAQVAVTTSVQDPRHDFETNALGTFNVLEAIRMHCPEAYFIYASTNKVYGHLDNVAYVEEAKRYQFENRVGINEDQLLEFYSPYGCSKGAADQYTVDYHRIYGLRTATLRQSCIYGIRQFGVEDQGWIAWFIIARLLQRPITIFGNGKQVRDALYIDDLTNAYATLFAQPELLNGGIYNIGGGKENSLSLLEFLDVLSDLEGKKVDVSYAETRPGDQPIFIADNTKLTRLSGWSPQVSTREGIATLYHWIKENEADVKEAFAGI